TNRHRIPKQRTSIASGDRVPPEWIDPIAKRIDESDDFSDVPTEARPLMRLSAIMAAAAKDSRLKKRTLTNLYNERPTWLKLAHETLDRAVLAACRAEIDQRVLANLLRMNQTRARRQSQT